MTSTDPAAAVSTQKNYEGDAFITELLVVGDHAPLPVDS